MRLPESRRRDRARVSASVEHDQAVATKRLGYRGGEVRCRQAAADGSREQVRTRLRHDAGSHRRRVAMTLIRQHKSRRSVRRRSLVARYVNDAMAVPRRRAVELVDGHLQDGPRSLAVRPGHLDEDVVAEPSEPVARRQPVAVRGQLFRDAHCVSHGEEDVELRQQLYQLPHDVVFGLPVQVPMPCRVRLQVDRAVADPLFGLPAEIGREQFRHR